MSSTHWNLLSAWSKAGVGTNLVLELKPPLESSSLSSSSSSSTEKESSSSNPSKKKTKPKSPPRVAFDMGATPCFDDAIPAKYVFISHGHIDHIGGLFSHARAHAVICGGTATTYFVPAELLPQLEKCHEAISLLDTAHLHSDYDDDHHDHDEKKHCGRHESIMKLNFVPVKPGDEFPLSGIRSGSKTSFFIRAFRADHVNHPALGYLLCSRTTSGLKEEYQNLDGKSIRDLVKSGINIKADPVENVEVAYTGDTCADGLVRPLLDKNINNISNDDNGGLDVTGVQALTAEEKSDRYISQIFEADLILSELTFLDSTEADCDRNMAKERGHLHIAELDRIFSRHLSTLRLDSGGEGEDSESDLLPSIVFLHLSGRYRPAKHALDLICEGIPQYLRGRCKVAISSMLSEEEKRAENSFVELIHSNGCISVADYLKWKNSDATEA